MKKEYWVALIGGIFLLSYVLEAVINPLQVAIATPYEFVQPKYLTLYPFTAAIIFMRALAIFLTPLFIMGFFKNAYAAKALTLILLAGLLQLYALQNIVNPSRNVPLEWALSLALGGLALLLPALFYGLKAMFFAMHQSLVKSLQPPVPPGTADAPTPEWLQPASAPTKKSAR